MRLLFATGRDYLPERVGGAELSVHALLWGLARSGWQCEAVCGIGPSWRHYAYRALRLLSRRGRTALTDSANGYPTHRAWEELIVKLVIERLERFRPDVVLTQLELASQIAAASVERGIATIVRVPDTKLRWLDQPLPKSPLLLSVSNSEYTRARIAERAGIESEVIYPIVRLGDYRTARTPELITFINPVPDKGVELALAIAALLPSRRFLFVETWPLTRKAKTALVARARALGNVRVRRWSREMRAVYARTALLLVPSQWEESFPRVILEAQASGIPIAARPDGGIPEAMGDGGLLLSGDAAAWARAIEDTLSDPRRYEELSRRATANAARSEFDADAQVARFAELASRHARSGR